MVHGGKGGDWMTQTSARDAGFMVSVVFAPYPLSRAMPTLIHRIQQRIHDGIQLRGGFSP